MAASKRAVLDTATRSGKHVHRRLENELIIWLATSGAEGRPHVVPVWFWWDGKSFLIYSLPGQKVRDIEANPKVAMHFNATRDGGDVVRIDGEAARLRRHPPAHRVPDYIHKYARLIKSYDWEPEGFSRQYHIALRVRPTRFRTD
ncbi:MAG: TIGR03667 family PPOX class F420-dependent oxidoreductase [Candidatus Dormibacteraeota bacterium]|nr:TIGR03667 family PPOX class F420-dependent oxidoreductase [Candidatus Dormibacteraeota bacterium]